MADIRAFKALSLLTTSGVLVVTACTIQLRGGDESPALPKAEQTTGADYRLCQQIWAENRRRFLGKKTGAAVPGEEDPTAGLVPVPKDQSRIPQGYRPSATPEASKP
jgi:Conjugative transfer region protein TrbK